MLEIPYKIHPILAAHTEYRSALYETLKYLRPKYCLEIGTNHGASAIVFQRYFDEYMEDGRLITCDIKIYNKLNLPNVTQIQVHSWIDNPWNWHHGNDTELINDERNNLQIILDTMNKLNIPELDFSFIDGDHTEKSVNKDMDMVGFYLPMKLPKYILLDDTDSKDQDVGRIYRDHIKKNPKFNTYDFENWPCRVAASLIWMA
jgi:cephalosporin hydroxylase